MSTIEIIGKHDVLCSSLNFATPEGAAQCDCNLSVMADMLEALEQMLQAFVPVSRYQAETTDKARAAVARARGAA